MLKKERYIRTRTGRKIYPFNLTPDQFDIEDIAASLSKSCRWTGHTPWHYSVAEHSIRVMNLLPEELQLQGLLHDASEAYLSDMAKPVKLELPDYVALEKSLERVISERFGLPFPLDPLVKQADIAMLHVEGIRFFPREWSIDNPMDGVSGSIPDQKLFNKGLAHWGNREINHTEAYFLFIDRYELLRFN